jgi:hypothetical protein
VKNKFIYFRKTLTKQNTFNNKNEKIVFDVDLIGTFGIKFFTEKQVTHYKVFVQIALESIINTRIHDLINNNLSSFTQEDLRIDNENISSTSLDTKNPELEQIVTKDIIGNEEKSELILEEKSIRILKKVKKLGQKISNFNINPDPKKFLRDHTTKQIERLKKDLTLQPKFLVKYGQGYNMLSVKSLKNLDALDNDDKSPQILKQFNNPKYVKQLKGSNGVLHFSPISKDEGDIRPYVTKIFVFNGKILVNLFGKDSNHSQQSNIKKTSHQETIELSELEYKDLEKFIQEAVINDDSQTLGETSYNE